MKWPDENPKMPPLRVVLNAVEGWGKTTAGAHAPDPVILMASGETGYTTLYGAGLVPRVPCFYCESWEDTLNNVRSLTDNPDGRKTVVLDALSGFERLCHEFVCKRDFKGDWTEKGFASYQQGYDVSAGVWLKLLAALDHLRTKHNMTTVLLSHSLVKSFKNPMGADFDRYIADCHHKTWSSTHRWADAVLFGNFITVFEDAANKKGKVSGKNDRVIYTERRDAFDAKNRMSMPESVDIPNDRTQVWSTIWNAITGESK